MDEVATRREPIRQLAESSAVPTDPPTGGELNEVNRAAAKDVITAL